MCPKSWPEYGKWLGYAYTPFPLGCSPSIAMCWLWFNSVTILHKLTQLSAQLATGISWLSLDPFSFVLCISANLRVPLHCSNLHLTIQFVVVLFTFSSLFFIISRWLTADFWPLQIIDAALLQKLRLLLLLELLLLHYASILQHIIVSSLYNIILPHSPNFLCLPLSLSLPLSDKLLLVLEIRTLESDAIIALTSCWQLFHQRQFAIAKRISTENFVDKFNTPFSCFCFSCLFSFLTFSFCAFSLCFHNVIGF